MNWRFWTWFDWKDGMWGPDPYNGTLVRSDMERFEVLGDDQTHGCDRGRKEAPMNTACDHSFPKPYIAHCSDPSCGGHLVVPNCTKCGAPNTEKHPASSPLRSTTGGLFRYLDGLSKDWSAPDAHIPFADEPQYTD